MNAPTSVVAASILQVSIALTFLLMGAAAYRYGSDAQEAAEAEIVAQGLPAEVLRQQGVNFAESGFQLALPTAIALLLTALAVPNLSGEGVGRIASFVLQPVLLVVGGIITAEQVFAARYISSVFGKPDDPVLHRVDVERFVLAAMAAFPSGFRPLVIIRFALVTLGSSAITALLALHSASVYFG